MRRSDTTRKKYFRSRERLFRYQGQWYFQTREGDRGPFNTREEAKLELERFADTMEYVEGKQRLLPSEVDWGDATMVDIDKPNRYSG